MAGVSLERVSKRYRNRRETVDAVVDVSLSAPDRSFVVLVGPSGCGKTTTLRLVAGLESPDAGTIRIGGEVVNRTAPKDRDVAMVFQNYALYPHMTVFKNMAFGLSVRGVCRADVRERVGKVADTLGIAALLDRKPAALSGGERQRVALGRAMVRRPRAFLLDEPLANLDAGLRATMRTELKRLHRQLQSTVLYVTHDQEEAMTLGDQIVVLRRGRVLQSGPPLDVYRKPANRFVAGLIGTPPINLIRGKMTVGADGIEFECAFGTLRLPRDAAATVTGGSTTDAVLGIRPEHLGVGGSDAVGAALVPSPPEATDNACFRSLVAGMIEPLGDQMNVHLQPRDDTQTDASLLVRVPSSTAIRMGQRLDVTVRRGQVHLFSCDADGRRLD